MKISTSPARPICFILPPYLLKQLVLYGSEAQRKAALQSLGIDFTVRTNRTTIQAETKHSHHLSLGISTPKKNRVIYNANHKEELPGFLARQEGQPETKEISVDEAYDGLGATFDFFASIFHRNSIDDEGLSLRAIVHYGEHYNNAFWDGQQMVFGDGDGEIFNQFTHCLDVIGHELTHGVVGDEANFVYLHQAGALNESIADVFGSLIKQYHQKQTVNQADWLIGKGLFVHSAASALRSLKAPGTAYDLPRIGKDPQPKHMDHYVNTLEDNGGVHINSGIPNHAFYLLAMALGGFAWEKAGKIWYEALRDSQIRKTADFIDFAQSTILHAGHLYGSRSVEQKAVIDSWNEVGVKIP